MRIARRLTFAFRRIRPQLQAEAAECSAACLCMIADYLGYRVTIAELRRTQSISLRGASINDLVAAADSIGLRARAVKVDISELNRVRLPAVIHWRMNHFVVLERQHLDGARIVDPAVGRRRISREELSESFTGVALEVAPGQLFRARQPLPTLGLRHFLTEAPGLPRQLAIVLGLSLVLQSITLLTPFYAQWVVDDIVISGDTSLLGVLALSFATLAVLHAVLTATRGWLVIWISARLSFDWATGLFAHLLRLPVDYFEKRNIGDIQSRFGSLQPVRELLTTQTVEGLIDGAMAIVILAVLLYYDLGLTAIVLLSVSLYALLRLSLLIPARARTLEIVRQRATVEAQLLETLRGIYAVKSYSLAHCRHREYERRTADAVQVEASLAQLNVSQQVANQLLFALQNVAVLWLGAIRVIDGRISTGMLIAFIAYKHQFSTRSAALVDKLIEFRLIRAHLSRLSDIVEQPADSAEATIGPSKDHYPDRPQLAFDNLGFRYADNEPFVFRDLTLALPALGSVALVAPSGFGKTTLLKVLAGLLQPVEGSIRLGTRTVTAHNIADYRSNVSFVMQNDVLFNGSIADNIAMFAEYPDDKQIQAAAQLAAVHDEVMAMPMAYRTLIGDMGSTLSGGQQQRIVLARALYRQPRILLLDEATSHLDAAKEREVAQSLAALKLLRIHVAHRETTISHCDTVLHLDKL